MQDSASNPYIPQESQQNRAKVYEFKSPLGSAVKWAMIITGIVAVLIGGGLFYVVPKTTAVDQPNRIQLADALQPPDQTLKRVSVTSKLGFTFNYDNRVYASYAEAGDSSAGTDSSSAVANGETYENNDLRVSRAYNYIRIRPIESADTARALKPIPPQLEVYATTTDNELVKAAQVPENKGMSKLSLLMKIDGDKRMAKRTLDDNTVVKIDASKPSRVNVGSVQYEKVRFTTTNTNHRVTNVRYDDCYYTIQFDQPFVICVSGVRPTTVSAASLVERVFDSLTYQQPEVIMGASGNAEAANTQKKADPKTTSFVNPIVKLAQAVTFDSTDSSGDGSGDTNSGQSQLLTITPEYYNDADSLKAIAKSQPSVVRIGTLYCADLSLKFESGETATTLSEACAGTVASGVFVSSDGYVATTGHAIRTQKKAAIIGYINFAPDLDQMVDRLQRILDYLVKAKIILDSDEDYLLEGARTSDQEALAKIDNLTSIIPDNFIVPVKEEYSYAVQPTDKPIVINRSDTNKPSFAYSDSVLSAKYIASDYDLNKTSQEAFDSATPPQDVGLLKVDGTFPAVPIIQQEDVKANSILSIVGFPAYSDSSLSVDKIRNMPVVTSASVDQSYQKDGVRLISTTLPTYPGNDGAPALDKNGNIVGFAVYGFGYCPDQQCFGNGTVRSSNDLMKLLDENNIKLSTGSQIYNTWATGVDEYFRSNYSASTSEFGKSVSSYAFNRWASSLQKLSGSLQGSKLDTSLMNQLQAVMIVVLVIAVIATILLGIAFGVHRKRIQQLQVGHYGAPVISPTPQVSQPVVSQQPQPAQSYPNMYGSPQPTYGAQPQTTPQPQPQQQQATPFVSSPGVSGQAGLSVGTPPQQVQQPPAPTQPQMQGPQQNPFGPSPQPTQQPNPSKQGPTDSFYS